MPQTRFTKEFRDEAVRLALTSGRSRRAIAEDLGVGLSTLRNWIDRRRGFRRKPFVSEFQLLLSRFGDGG